MNKEIIGIIVTYNFDQNLKHNLNNIIKQIDSLIIIDNGSTVCCTNFLQNIQKKYSKKVSIIYNKQNLGLARAQNQGLIHLKPFKPKWVIFFDQDSNPEKNMIKNILEVAKHEKYSLLGPQIIEDSVKKQTKYLIKKRNSLFFQRVNIEDKNLKNNVYGLISSGSVIKFEVFEKIGLFRENFFIDYIDFEFCLRAKLNNYKIFIVENSFLFHKQGNQTSHDFFGFQLYCHNYDKKRRFTIARNRFFLMRIFFKPFPGILKIELLAIFYDIFRILTFEKNSLSKLLYYFKGIIHGLIKTIPKITYLK